MQQCDATFAATFTVPSTMTDVRNCAPRLPATISETRTHTHSWHTNPAAKTVGIRINNSGRQSEQRQAVSGRDGACQKN